ncbi:transcription antiterminator [Lactobacillus sp. ESL0791]|uniref:BglG family transcription antiterminator n=1 Tax=Lactobacillus sp. ESL0791 TaxID=2983234 RepID=UPI0023F6832C|nr:transcription antiterminator [Lactobacillus sp. ESL0791]MDF7639592.1 transcription antiterminator [Lactobacillus sp. ESL0791]
MRTRDKEILLKIIKDGTIGKKELSNRFRLTDRQIEYSISSINDELEENNIVPVTLKNNNFAIGKQAVAFFNDRNHYKNIIFSPEVRQRMMLIMILERTKPISLNDFIIDLQVSKNTILADLKSLNSILRSKELIINFTRKKGYIIKGKEWDKRLLLEDCIMDIYEKYGFNTCTQILPNIQANLSNTRQGIKTIEDVLGKKYADDDYFPLILFLTLVLNRISAGKTIDDANAEIASDKEIEETNEYQVLNKTVTIFRNLSVPEKRFIALHILSANVKEQAEVSDSVQSRLVNALWEFLNDFELNSFIVLPDKKDLLRNLIDHFRPAYYRIKYGLPTHNPLYKEISNKYKELNDLVTKSIKPLEDFFQTKITEDEIAYITIFIGSHLIKNDSSNAGEKIIHAITVCPNGTSASKILESSLKKAFPEFFFYPSCTVREYNNFLLPHDVVFSTVPLKSKKTTFIINDILNTENIINLRNSVFKKIFNLSFGSIDSDSILQLVNKYADIHDSKMLKKELDNLLLPKKSTLEPQLKEPNYAVTDKIKNITLVTNNIPLDQAVTLLVQPLIKQNIVSENFLDKLKTEYKDQPQYILLKNRIVLFHLDPDLIQQKLSLNLLISKTGIIYHKRQIHVLALLTTPDKTKQLQLLYLVKQMAENESFLSDLSSAQNKQEVMNQIKKFTGYKEANLY